eukprot:scaffold113892_cov26-Cyclotella_meneghiniana.AAC.1
MSLSPTKTSFLNANGPGRIEHPSGHSYLIIEVKTVKVLARYNEGRLISRARIIYHSNIVLDRCNCNCKSTCTVLLKITRVKTGHIRFDFAIQ